MPKEKPNEKQIREVMKTAEKVASGEKAPPEEKPKPEVKEKPSVEKKPLVEKKPPTTPSEEEKPQPQAPPQDPVYLLGKTVDRLTDVVGKLEARLAENKTEVVNSGEGETKGKEQEEISPEQELAMLQQAQQAAQQGQQPGQEGQVPPGGGNPLYIYLIGKSMDMVGKVLPAALMKVTGGGGEGAGDTLSQLATEWLTAKIKSDILGEGGGGGGGSNTISIDQINAMASFLTAFFGGLGKLPKPTAEALSERTIGPSPTEEPIT